MRDKDTDCCEVTNCVSFQKDLIMNVVGHLETISDGLQLLLFNEENLGIDVFIKSK